MKKPDYSRAREIIKALIQGVNPLSGDALPADNILNNADVLRAMLVAAVSIEESIARAARRAQLPGNVGNNWSKEEEATLVAAYKAGEQPPVIAARHGRTIRAIEARLERLGIMTADQRTTDNSFTSPSKIDDTDE